MNSKLKLVMTCSACPEQYDVYFGEDQIGYLRLRHGFFRAEYKGEMVFSGYPNGDGCFEGEERNKWLTRACIAILHEHEDTLESLSLYEVVDDV